MHKKYKITVTVDESGAVTHTDCTCPYDYTLLAREIDKYENLRFRLHFIDEAQYINNHNTPSIKL